MANMKRASFTLPPSVVDDLDYISRRMGATKSFVVSEVLGEALGPLSALLRSIPENATAADANAALMRFRGASGDVIRGRLDALRDTMDSIDPDAFELSPCEDRPAGCSCDYSTGERVPPASGCFVHGDGGAKRAC